MPFPQPHLPRFGKFLFGNSLQQIWLNAKICPMMPLWVGVKCFSIFFWVLGVLHAHHHRKEEDLGRRRAVAPQRCGADKGSMATVEAQAAGKS